MADETQRIQVLRHSDDTVDEDHGSIFQSNQRLLMLVIGHEFFDPRTGEVKPEYEVTFNAQVSWAIRDYQKAHPTDPPPPEAADLVTEAADIIKKFRGEGEDPTTEELKSWEERVEKMGLSL